MIDKELFDFLYHNLYALSAIFATLIALTIAVRRNSQLLMKSSQFLMVITIMMLIVSVGLRGYDVGADTISYYFKWQQNFLSELKTDYLLYLIMYLVKFLGFSYQFFLLIIAVIFFFVLYKSIQSFSRREQVNPYLVFFSFFSFFFLSSLSINVIRQGLSLIFLLWAYPSIVERKPQKTMLLILISISFHLTSIIPVLLFGLVYSFKNIELKYFVFLYVMGILLAYFNFGLDNVSPLIREFLGDDKRISYLSGNEHEYYQIGFRSYFAVFNTIFLILFLRFKMKSENIQYDLLLKYYITASFIFFMAFQIPFSDRWGLFSWVVIPFLLAPAWKTAKIRKFQPSSYVLLLIFLFLFFNFIYQ